MQSMDFSSLTSSALSNPLTHKDLSELEQFYDFISELNEIYQKVLFNAPTYDSVAKVRADIQPICIRAWDIYKRLSSSNAGSIGRALFTTNDRSVFNRLDNAITHRATSGSTSGIATIGSWGTFNNTDRVSYTEMNPQISVESLYSAFSFPAIVRMQKGHNSGQPYMLSISIQPDFGHCSIIPALFSLIGPNSLALSDSGAVCVKLLPTVANHVNIGSTGSYVGIMVNASGQGSSNFVNGSSLGRVMTLNHNYGGGSSTRLDKTIYTSVVAINAGSGAFNGNVVSGDPILLTEYLTECNIFNLLPNFLKEVDTAKQFVDWFYTTINGLIENIDLNDEKRRENVAKSMRYGALQQASLVDIGLGTIMSDAFDSLMNYLKGSDSDI